MPIFENYLTAKLIEIDKEKKNLQENRGQKRKKEKNNFHKIKGKENLEDYFERFFYNF